MDAEWKPIATVPADSKIDVFYCNPTFDWPVEGVIFDAQLLNGEWVGSGEGGVPEIFAISWRPSSHDLGRVFVDIGEFSS